MPLTVLRATPETRYLVVEMGARGVGHVAELCAIAPPTVAAVLNVGTAHIGEFGSREAIAQAKGEIVEALPADGTAVLNADDHLVAAMAARTAAQVVTFGGPTDGPAPDVAVSDVTTDELGRQSFELAHRGSGATVHLAQVGAYQWRNAAAAAAMALAAGLDLDTVADSLADAVPASRWRMELAERPDGLVVVNDAYNANPESMRGRARDPGRHRRPHRSAYGRRAGRDARARRRAPPRPTARVGRLRRPAAGVDVLVDRRRRRGGDLARFRRRRTAGE